MEDAELLVMIDNAQKRLDDLEASGNKDAIDRQKAFVKRLLDRHDTYLKSEKVASGMSTTSNI